MELEDDKRAKITQLIERLADVRDCFLRLQGTIMRWDNESPGPSAQECDRVKHEIDSIYGDLSDWFEQMATELVKGNWVSDRAQALSWLYFYGGRLSNVGALDENIARTTSHCKWMRYDTAERYCIIQGCVSMYQELKKRLEHIDKQKFDRLSIPSVVKDRRGAVVLGKSDRGGDAERFPEIYDSVRTAAEELKAKMETLYQEVREAWEKTRQLIESDRKQAVTIITSALEVEKAIQDKRDSADKVLQDLKKQGDGKLQELVTLAETGEANIDTAVNKCKAQYQRHLKELNQFKDIALAEGLSKTYLDKEKNEKETYEKYTRRFYWALGFLALILSTPTIIFLLGHIPYALFSWMKVGTDYWKLFLLYPLEVPTIWLLFLFSKRAKIAYRLAEDYTHKRLVGLVYQGLREKVNELGEENAEDAKRLQALLLQAVITTTATNSGDLIKGFNNPDCPITDVLKSFEIAGSKVRLTGE